MYIQFFEDQYKILEKFPSDVRWKTLDAIMLYVFKGTEPKLEGARQFVKEIAEYKMMSKLEKEKIS